MAESGLWAWWKRNDLSLVLLAMFLASWGGQLLTGHSVYDDDRAAHGLPGTSLATYVRSAHFAEATFENWESEFLQAAVLVLLTVFLKQRGSQSSKHTAHPNADVDEVQVRPDSPWPVRAGGWIRKLYENSLGLVLVAIFLATFVAHVLASHAAHDEEEAWHGGPPTPVLAHLRSDQLWFESFQNWQSEFLAVLAMTMLTIYLRQRGSPESKPVGAPIRESRD